MEWWNTNEVSASLPCLSKMIASTDMSKAMNAAPSLVSSKA